MKSHRAPQCERGACDVHRGAREAICKRGAPLEATEYRGVSGRKREPSGTPQCERGASLTFIGAPVESNGRLYAKEGCI